MISSYRQTLISDGELAWGSWETFQNNGGFIHEWTKVKGMIAFTKSAGDSNLPIPFPIPN